MKSLLINGIKFKVDFLFSDKIRLVPIKIDHSIKLARIAESIRNAKVSSIENIVGSRNEILIHSSADIKQLKKELATVKFSDQLKPRSFDVPICFSKGHDWDNVIGSIGKKKNAIIDQLLQSNLHLSMYGFLPGFMYLGGLHSDLHIPRKTTPAKQTSPGSIGLGGPFAGIYNLKSPAGWHIIGHCPIQIFNLKEIENPTMKIGDEVRFIKISLKEWKELNTQTLSIKDYTS